MRRASMGTTRGDRGPWRTWWQRWVGGIATAALALSIGAGAVAEDETPAPAGDGPVVEPGSFTRERPYLVAEDPTFEIVPILTTGDVMEDYQMAAVPDGLGAYVEDDEVVVFMNHELTTDDDENLSNARVSRLVLNRGTGAVTSGEYVVGGTEGYERLCSAFLAGPEVGFDDRVFLTGEETTGSEHGGIVIGVDAESGEVTDLPWLGHFPHENAVVIPGFEDQTVVFLTDDDADGAEAYLYVADSPEGVLNGEGQLYVFVADGGEGTADVGKGTELTGEFVPVDEDDNADAEALQQAADDAGAFGFARLEDATYDRTNTTTIYFADTGDNDAPNVVTSTGDPVSANGRLYSMTLDPSDPTRVAELSVLLDGDAGDDMRNPDNLDANETTILIQEDLNDYNREEDSENNGRVLAYDIATGVLRSVARIDQSDDPDRLVDEGDEAGSWESSGIIDVSDIFGEGTWLLDVQAHTLEVEQFDGTDQGGQLLLMRQVTPVATPVVEATAAPVETAPPVETAVPVETVPVPTVEPTPDGTPVA